MSDLSEENENLDPDIDEFYEFDLDTGRDLIIIVYNEDEDELEIENPSELPPPMVRGLLEQALDDWRDSHSPDWVSADDEDD